VVISVLVIVVIALIAVIVSFISKDSKGSIISKIEKHMILPSESPVVAEVTDKEKLQSSLKRSTEKGDYVLLYDKAQKVIVYRPSTDRIIDVQPILYGSQPNPNFNATIAIYNGSGSENVAKKFIEKLYTSYPNVRLIAKEDVNRTFPSTIVLTEDETSTVPDEIANTLNIKAGIVPEGIDAGKADITFVVGIDYK
jgi:hypothetical protein